MKLSQMQSRFICKFLRKSKKYSLKIRDSLEFWRFTPEAVREYIQYNYHVNVPLDEIISAARK